MPDSSPRLLARCTRLLFSRGAVGGYWIVNLALLLALVTWIYHDGRFAQLAGLSQRMAPWNQTPTLSQTLPDDLVARVQLLQGMLWGGLATAVGILLALVWGDDSSRTIRAWLAVMAILAGWLTLYTSWPDLAWLAQAQRLRAALPTLETHAQTLRDHWPREGNHLPGLGSFNAYPLAEPRTLMLLQKPLLPGTQSRLALVERTSNDSLVFRLAGDDDGAALLRMASGDQPQPYQSGLAGEFQPLRFRQLDGPWYLVRYRQVR